VNKEPIDSCYTCAAERALEFFPVEVEDVRFIKRSENITFRVFVRESDTDYVLRLHRPGYNSIGELNSERAWTAALELAGLPVPTSLLTHQGKHFELIDIPDTGEQCHTGMTTWAEGSPLCDHLESVSGQGERSRIFRKIGELLAAIHNQATAWDEPQGFDRRRLDLSGLLGEEPLWGQFWEHADLTGAERRLLLDTRTKLRDQLITYGQRASNFSLIHADLNPENIIYSQGHLALIDFDDSAYGWHMYEIATSLFECVFSPGFDTLTDTLLDGYREHRELATGDVEMLPAFLLIRGMALIGWFHQRPEHEGSAFFEEVKNWVVRGCDAYG